MVRDILPNLRVQVPPSVQMQPLFDRSISIRAAVTDVQETLAIAIALVILVIFLFLRKVSATIIPALAVPVSLIGTCAAMYAFGFSINNMTLLALTLSVGFVVDDAIVMLENIVRHVEGGMRPFEAALKGAREIGFTIISITFSLIAVFIPVLLMGGMVGRVFREFAVSIAVAIVVSGFVSLTLTPMLCARVLRPHREGEKQNIVLRGFETMFKAGLRAYEWSLDRVLRYKAVTLVVTNPTLNIGRMFIALKPRNERGENSTAVIQRLRRTANVVPGMAVYFQNVQNINITGRISKSEYQYTLQSSDTQLLYDLAPKLRDKIAEIEGLRDVTTDLYIKSPQMTVEIDREKAAVYGVTIDQVRQELFNAFGARQVATIYTPTNDYQVILESQPQFQADPSQLQNIFVKTNITGGGGTGTGPGAGVNGNGIPSGNAIPLSAVTRIAPAVGPLQVNHQGNQPAVTISFNLAPGYSLGQAVDAIKGIERESRLPITVSTGFQGSAQVFQDSLKGQGVLVLAAVFAAYVVL